MLDSTKASDPACQAKPQGEIIISRRHFLHDSSKIHPPSPLCREGYPLLAAEKPTGLEQSTVHESGQPAGPCCPRSPPSLPLDALSPPLAHLSLSSLLVFCISPPPRGFSSARSLCWENRLWVCGSQWGVSPGPPIPARGPGSRGRFLKLWPMAHQPVPRTHWDPCPYDRKVHRLVLALGSHSPAVPPGAPANLRPPSFLLHLQHLLP